MQKEVIPLPLQKLIISKLNNVIDINLFLVCKKWYGWLKEEIGARCVPKNTSFKYETNISIQVKRHSSFGKMDIKQVISTATNKPQILYLRVKELGEYYKEENKKIIEEYLTRIDCSFIKMIEIEFSGEVLVDLKKSIERVLELSCSLLHLKIEVTGGSKIPFFDKKCFSKLSSYKKLKTFWFSNFMCDEINIAKFLKECPLQAIRLNQTRQEGIDRILLSNANKNLKLIYLQYFDLPQIDTERLGEISPGVQLILEDCRTGHTRGRLDERSVTICGKSTEKITKKEKCLIN